jgi:hypothetical protein
MYVAASMVWLGGEFQRDDSLMTTWEKTYMDLLSSSVVEEARKKYFDSFPRPTKPTAGLGSTPQKSAA